jgi:hypothetical protein
MHTALKICHEHCMQHVIGNDMFRRIWQENSGTGFGKALAENSGTGFGKALAGKLGH